MKTPDCPHASPRADAGGPARTIDPQTHDTAFAALMSDLDRTPATAPPQQPAPVTPPADGTAPRSTETALGELLSRWRSASGDDDPQCPLPPASGTPGEVSGAPAGDGPEAAERAPKTQDARVPTPHGQAPDGQAAAEPEAPVRNAGPKDAMPRPTRTQQAAAPAQASPSPAPAQILGSQGAPAPSASCAGRAQRPHRAPDPQPSEEPASATAVPGAAPPALTVPLAASLAVPLAGMRPAAARTEPALAVPDLPHSPSAEARPGEAPTGHSGTAVRATVLHRETHFAPVTPGRPAGVSIPEPATSDRPDTSDIAIDAPEPRHPTPAPRADVEPPSTSTAASPAPMGAWLGATPAPALPQVSLAQVGAAITQEARRLQAGRPADANDGAQMRGPVRVLEMALSPESLGRVVIRLRLTAGGLDVRIRASLPETARMLEQDRGHLARLMADQGLELNDLQLETGPSLGRFGTAGFVPEPPRFEPPGFEPPRANDQSAADQSPDDNGRRRDPRDPPPQDQPHQDPADEDPARRP